MADRILFLETPDIPKTPVGEEQGEGSLTPAQETAIAANTAARHTHSNKAVLAEITAQDLDYWDGKADASDIPDVSGFITLADVPAELPAVTASDNGKFLRVVNGAWAAQTVPSAESNSFGGGS